MKALEHLPAVEIVDVRPRRVLVALLIVFVLMVTCVASATVVLVWTKPAGQAPMHDALRLGIRLEVAPQVDDHRAEVETAKRLVEAGWNDEARTSAHIPIAHAMELLAQQGWPDAAPGNKQGALP